MDVSAGAPDVADLQRQIAELQSQLQHATTPPATPVVPPASSCLQCDAAVLPTPLVYAAPMMGSSPPVAPPAAPTHLLAPAQPVTQDLLVNTLRQMAATAPSAPDELRAATSDIAQFLVLGATLDPKLRAKIREGAYVDLGGLMSSTDTSVSVAMGADGQPNISLTPVRARPQASISEWLRRFCTYASVYLECLPDEAPVVMTYMVNIMDMQRRHEGFAWRAYDERFRRVLAMSPQLPWHVTNWDLAMAAIHGSAPQQHLVCQGAPVARSPFRGGRRLATGRVCFNINYRSCSRPQCSYTHSCVACGRQGHPSRSCRAAQPGKGRARPAVAGTRPPP